MNWRELFLDFSRDISRALWQGSLMAGPAQEATKVRCEQTSEGEELMNVAGLPLGHAPPAPPKKK